MKLLNFLRHRASVFLTIALLAGLLCPAPNSAQDTQPDLTVDAKTRDEVIEGALKALNEGYVFPETAKKMEQAIRERIGRKEYDNIASAASFAATLTAHLQEVSKDKHLRVLFNDGSRPMFGGQNPADRERARVMAAKRNFGFEKVERLDGNIGYLDLRGFENLELARDTAAAAMNFLANTDALIIDLRQNGGGQPDTVAFISSYLFDKRTHLNDIYDRLANTTREFWTSEDVPGKRYGDKPVFVLTSKRTFSAAEEFTYNLKNLKRATIIGETTGGGAHPVNARPLGKNFLITVPFARAINPITKTNWEGVGVKPDIEAAAENALKVARLAALKSALARINDQRLADQLKAMIESLRRELGDIALPASFEPGTSRAYSNGGYIVLGAIIEKVTGQSYYDYVRERIFKPAGMENTDSYEVDASVPNLATGYLRNEKGERVSNVYTKPARGSSAGGGYSTVEDMLKFTIALQSNKLLSHENSRKLGGGLGIAGGAPGINAALELDPTSGYTIIVLSNYDPPSAGNVSEQIRKLIAQVGN
ncbi:MAG: serine hydrolase [Blastocatellia bacterium]